MRAFLQFIARRRCLQLGIKLIAIVLFASAPKAIAQLDGSGNYDDKGVLWTPWNPEDWTRRFRLGAVLGFNIGAKFNMNGQFNVSGNNPADGIYDDGYVRVDDTGNEGGVTGFWGYDNASQYNSGANTLSMHGVNSFTAADKASADAGVVPGIDLAYSAYIWNGKHLSIGWEIGFDWLPIGISANQSLSGTVDETTYIFDTGGIVIPSAPYQGGSSGTGPLLPGTPSSTTETISSATITGNQTLDLNLYIFRLGPTFNVDLGRNFSLTAGVGPALGLVDGSLQFDENIITTESSTSTKGKISATQLVYGGYVNVTALYHLPSDAGHADMYISTQYMPLTSATFKGAGREGQLQLSGQLSISIGFNWPF